LADADPLAHLKSYIHGHVCAGRERFERREEKEDGKK
jgi:hypothetical protein